MKLPTHSPVFYKITKSHFSYSRFCSFLHTLNTNEMQRRNGNKHGALSFRKVTQEWATGSYRFGCWSNKIKKRTWTTYYSFVSIHSSSSIASACQISHDVDACNRQTWHQALVFRAEGRGKIKIACLLMCVCSCLSRTHVRTGHHQHVVGSRRSSSKIKE